MDQNKKVKKQRKIFGLKKENGLNNNANIKNNDITNKEKNRNFISFFMIAILLLLIFFLFFIYKHPNYESNSNKKEKIYTTFKENNLQSIVNINKLALVMGVNEEETIKVSLDKYYDEKFITWTSNNDIINVDNCSGLQCQIKTNDIEGEAIITVTYTAGYDENKYKNTDTIIISVVKKEEINFYRYNDGEYSYYTIDKLSSPNNTIQEDDSYSKVATYHCITTNCDVKSTGNYFALIYDNDTYYEFNYNSKETTENKNISTLNDDSIKIIDNSKKILGYSYTVEENYNYKYYLYSNNLNKVIDEYETVNFMNKDLLENNILFYSKKDSKNINVLNLETGNLEKSLELEFEYGINDVVTYSINNKIIYGLSEGIVEIENIVFIDNNYNKLFNGKKFYKARFYNELLYTMDDNATEYVVYDLNGNVKETIENKRVLDLYDKYILVVDKNNVLSLLNYDGSIKLEICNWESKYNYVSMVSGYNKYTNKEEYKDGYYIILEDSEIEYGEIGHAIKIYYNDLENEKKITKQTYTGAEGKAKPILYLYPTKKTKVKVKLEGFSPLTTTYPKYKNSWEVTANSNGDLYDNNGKYYYGLYWEEETPRKVNFSSGFYVESEDAIDFLEEKLEYIGLNDKERNEFITYWLPILEKNGKNLIYFEQTKELETNTHLNIKPTPDTLIRLTIHIKKVTSKIDIVQQQLTHYERKGFVAVEWGGINYE